MFFVAQINLLSLTLASFASSLLSFSFVLLLCKCCIRRDDDDAVKERLLAASPEDNAHVSFRDPPVTSVGTYDAETGEMLTMAI